MFTRRRLHQTGQRQLHNIGNVIIGEGRRR